MNAWKNLSYEAAEKIHARMKLKVYENSKSFTLAASGPDALAGAAQLRR